MTKEKKMILVLLLTFFFVVTSIFAQTSSTISVDYAVDLGASNRVASGALHGISAEYPAQYLIDGIQVNAIRGADYHTGGYLPNYYDKATYDRTKATGAKLMIGLYYYKGGDSYRPGDNGDWTKWAKICTDIYNEAQSKNYDVFSWITWNEPRLQWKNLDTYMEAHHVAYDTIKGLNPSALVQGPEDHSYNFDFLTSFLTFCKNNNCIPDILAWHELSTSPLDVEAHCRQIREWMVQNGIEPMPFAVTEYQGYSYGDKFTSFPGDNVHYLASMERAEQYGFAYGLHSCWSWVGEDPNFIATLGDMASKNGANLPRGMWWNYNAYKDMTGRKVQVNVDGSSADAFATTDSAMKRSTVMIGTSNNSTSNVTLTLNNIPSYLTLNDKVRIKAELVLDGMEVMTPYTVVNGDYPVSNNSVTLSLPKMAPHSSYIVHISQTTSDIPGISYEAEALSVSYSAGRTHRVFNETEASNGQATLLEATADGDYVEYTIPGVEAGVYHLRAIMKSALDRGFINLYVNGESVGAPEDEFGSERYYVKDFGKINVESVSDLNLRFVVVGKNEISTGRNMVFDRFDLLSSDLTTSPGPIPNMNIEPGSSIGIEAESASDQSGFAPFTVQSDSVANAGQYIVWPDNGSEQILNSPSNSATGQAKYTFNLAQSTIVHLSALVDFPTGDDDSFYYKYDDNSWNTQNHVSTSGWETFYLESTYLTPGSHTLTILRREDGAKIDQIKLESMNGEITGGNPINDPPTVDAGANATIQLSGSASLDGTVNDDNLPSGGTLTTTWSKQSGPGTVTFGNVSAVDTTATFSAAGTYVLQLTANDSELSTSDTVTITVVNGGTTIEAESASGQSGFAPFTVQSDSAASSGQYIAVPNGTGNSNMTSVTGNSVSYSFNLSEAATVTLKAKVLLPTVADDSFWYRLDSGAWTRQNDAVYTSWTTITLATYTNVSAGAHTINLAAREDGAQIDQIILEISTGTGSPSINIEMESASAQSNFSPFAEQSDANASGGKYIVWPNDGTNQNNTPASDSTTGQAAYTFTLSEAANVTFVMKANFPNGTDDSFHYKMDSGSWAIQNNTFTTGFADISVTTFTGLSAGTHTLTIQRREDGAALDMMTLTASAGSISN